MHTIAGLDAGNNTIILSMPKMKGESGAIIIPSITAPYSNYSFMRISKPSLIDALDVVITVNHDRKDAKVLERTLVGSLAEKVAKNDVRIRNQATQKCGDEELFKCMLTTLAYGAIKTQKKDTGSIEIEYKIVVGLPYKQFLKDADAFPAQLKGRHLVEFKGTYNATVKINISDAEADCEGFRPLVNMMVDSNGDFVVPARNLLKKYVSTLDIGEFTTELMTGFFEELDGKPVLEIMSPLCTGWGVGVANAKNALITELYKTKNTTITRYGIDVAMNSTAMPGIIRLSDGTDYDITDDYSRHLKDLASEIVQKVVDQPVVMSMVGSIEKIGLLGGAPALIDGAFAGYITDRLASAFSIKDTTKISALSNALTANADYFLINAASIWSQDKKKADSAAADD